MKVGALITIANICENIRKKEELQRSKVLKKKPHESREREIPELK